MTWVGALARAAAALGRGHRVHEGEESDVTDESGFTLIELMVVLLIMGILMAIAIPTFLGVTSTANDTSTQSNLTNVITAAKAIYARNDAYPKTTTMVTKLKADEPEFTFRSTGSTAQDKISVLTGTTTGTVLVVAAYMTKTQVCWVARAATTGVKYGFVPFGTGGVPAAASACVASTAVGADATSTKWPTPPAGH
jgi:type IV pilus assembly protein PilA